MRSLLALSPLPWQTKAPTFSPLQALRPPSIREDRSRAAKLSQCRGAASAHVQRLTLQTGTAPGRQALSSRAGPEPQEPQLPSACRQARLQRRRWGTVNNASCLMEMQSLEPAVLTLGNSMFLPQMKCSFGELVLVGFLLPPRLYKQNQH